MVRETATPTLRIASSALVSETLQVAGNGTLVVDDQAVIEERVFIDLGSSRKGFAYIGQRSKIKFGAILRCYNGSIRVGARTAIGEYTLIAGHGGVKIGDNVGIAGHCTIWASEHIMEDSQIPIRFLGETANGISIGDGVWIGSGARILDSVCIGDSSVVGAGSVVSRSLPPAHVCIGAPCQPVRRIPTTSLNRNLSLFAETTQ